MGMFDSLYIKCPKCRKLLQLQSKSGSCGLNAYTKRNLPAQVAFGMIGLIVKCSRCKKNWKFHCSLQQYARNVKIIQTKDAEDYTG